MASKPQDLERLLQDLERLAGKGSRVTLAQIFDAVGRRSFGPLLLVAGLLGTTPVSAVPGAPSTIAVITALVAGQIVFGRNSIWLPKILLKLAVRSAKLKKTVEVARKPARVVDRLVRPRLHVLTTPVADRLVALACLLLAVVVPPLELLPLVAFIPFAAIAVFGLGLIARDGLLVLAALVISGAGGALVAFTLLS